MNDERVFRTAGFVAERWRRLSPEQQKRLVYMEPDLIGAVDDLLYEFERLERERPSGHADRFSLSEEERQRIQDGPRPRSNVPPKESVWPSKCDWYG